MFLRSLVKNISDIQGLKTYLPKFTLYKASNHNKRIHYIIYSKGSQTLVCITVTWGAY